MEMDQDRDSILSPTSLRQKWRNSLPLPSCFSNKSSRHHHHREARLIRTSSGHAPDTKFNYRNFLSRNFGSGGGGGVGGGARHVRRHSSADFSYDAMSYALNFDERGGDDRDSDQFLPRNFTSRLPPSPVREFKTSACLVDY